MPSRQSAQEIRKQARERAVAAAASRERLARERFENLRTKQRAQAKANEDDLAAFFSAEASIADAEEQLETAQRVSTIEMAVAALAIVEREGSVRAAAQLIGIPTSRISALAKAADAARSDSGRVTPAGPNVTGAGGEQDDNCAQGPTETPCEVESRPAESSA